MSESRRAFALAFLLAAIMPGIPLFAFLALAQLPWPVVIGGTLGGWFVAALCALRSDWVAGEEGEQ